MPQPSQSICDRRPQQMQAFASKGRPVLSGGMISTDLLPGTLVVVTFFISGSKVEAFDLM
jgi:hypothetical protein